MFVAVGFNKADKFDADDGELERGLTTSKSLTEVALGRFWGEFLTSSRLVPGIRENGFFVFVLVLFTLVWFVGDAVAEESGVGGVFLPLLGESDGLRLVRKFFI